VCNLLVPMLLLLDRAVCLGPKSHKNGDHALTSHFSLVPWFSYDLQGYSEFIILSSVPGRNKVHPFRRMASSGMLRSVALVRTYVSD
jgi:hypothetical protein